MTFLRFLLMSFIACACGHAADDAAIEGILSKLGDADAATRKSAIEQLGATRDSRLIDFLDDYAEGSAYRWNGRVVVAPDTVTGEDQIKRALPLDAVTRAALAEAPVALKDLAAFEVGRRERSAARDAGTLLRLFAPGREARLTAVTRLGDAGDATSSAILTEIARDDVDAAVRDAAEEGLLLLRLAGDDAVSRRVAIAALGERGSARAAAKLRALVDSKPDAETTAAAHAAIARIDRWQSTVRGIGHVFNGLSLGSILILIALGLAVIFGLMGVINMAHGELVMIGAYATFATQKAFEAWLPTAWFPAYFIVAIPVAFIVAGGVGRLIEITVIRWLYGRPLETLLATYGVSLVLIQAVRTAFGNNCSVNSPAWLQGGVEVASGLVLPYARIFILVFCTLNVAGLVLLIGRTRLGLLLRATTQNRAMAGALGVKTRAIDGWAFTLGSGFAGMAGCALTLISNMPPNMGQDYIVDSFLVVVVGGVGKLAGVVIAGLGLGGATKLLEPWTEAVWAKVLVLLLVIAFIQWRPSGLFPQKGRMADA